MITEDRVMAILATTNPVPSLDELELVGLYDAEHLEAPEHGSDEMSTKQDTPIEAKPPQRRRPPAIAWAIAAAVVVVAGIGIVLATRSPEPEVADAPPPVTEVPGTTTPATAALTDAEVVEAGLTAWFSGDVASVEEYFAQPFNETWGFNSSHWMGELSEADVMAELEYLALAGDELTVDCSGEVLVECVLGHGTELGAALGEGIESNDGFRATVEDGMIVGVHRQSDYPQYTGGHFALALFLATENDDLEYMDCIGPPRSARCAEIEQENLDWFASKWRDSDPLSGLRTAMTAYYQSGCDVAQLAFNPDFGHTYRITRCPDSTIEFEQLLQAVPGVYNCLRVGDPSTDGRINVTCDVTYGNVMTEAIGKDTDDLTAATKMTFSVSDERPYFFFVASADSYATDQEVFASFESYAQTAGLSAQFASNCGSADNLTRDAACAQLILDNLEDWAAWHLANA